MGVESRDWYQEPPPPQRGRIGRGWRIAFGVVVALLVLGLSPPVSDRLGYELPFGLGEAFRGEHTLRIDIDAGLSTPNAGTDSLYAPHDPWQAWLAPEADCPRGEDAAAPERIQVQTVLCLVNFARAREGLRPLQPSPLLAAAAATKAADIVRCGQFAHEACGSPADRAARELGYSGNLGENLFVAERPLDVPRVAVDRWLNSPGHRENLLRPEWRTIGIARLAEADVEAMRDAVVWVNQFGE
jgi:hypothetical protein